MPIYSPVTRKKHNPKSSKNNINSSVEIKHGGLFVRKLEPLKFVHLILGTRSYKFNGTSFSIVSRSTAFYLILVCVLNIVINAINIIYYGESYTKLTLHGIVTYLMLISGTIHTTFFFISNINSTDVIKMFKNFDFIETSIPKMNIFLYSSVTLSIVLHFFDIIFMSTEYMSIFLRSFPNLYFFEEILKVFTILIYISNDYSVYQCGIIMNLTSSYGNVINNDLSKSYGSPDINLKNTDALLCALNTKVLQCASNKYNKCNRCNINYIIKMYDKILENLEIINRKYNIVVSKICYIWFSEQLQKCFPRRCHSIYFYFRLVIMIVRYYFNLNPLSKTEKNKPFF